MVLQISVNLRTFATADPGSWDFLAEQAAGLDAAGFDRLVVADHVVFGERLEEYGRPAVGGRTGGLQPTGPDGYWLEALTALAFIIGQTTTIRLGTNILVAALRRPVVLAKVAATLDVLSHGRLDLGVGIGWQREEYTAAGLRFEERGALLDEALRVCRTLWREKQAAYDSPSLCFERIHLMPKPVQNGGVPIWVSGTVNRRVVDRLAEFGTGWIPWGRDSDDIEGGIGRMREALARHDRTISGLQVVGILPARVVGERIDAQATVAGVARMAQAGVTDFRVSLSLPTTRQAVIDYCAPLVEAFRSATAAL
jgi:probable F420-dependent oxidoreductase